MRNFQKLVQERPRTRNNSDHIKIYDDFLPSQYFDKVKEYYTGSQVGWHYMNCIDTKGDYNSSTIICDEIDNWQLTNVSYLNDQPVNESYKTIQPLLGFITERITPVKTVIKIKTNLNPRTDKIVKHGFHIDFPYESCTTALLYINTNNGYTEFTCGTKVNSRENRLVTFPTTTFHTGTTCTDQQNRIVVNLNYF